MLSAIREAAIVVCVAAAVMAGLVLGVQLLGNDESIAAAGPAPVEAITTPSTPAAEVPAVTPTTDAAPSTTATAVPPARSPLAADVRELTSRLGVPDVIEGPTPIGLSFPAIGAQGPVDAVGVEDNGEMEIPGADRVGWYQYGPAPGAPGSAVLAAHIAFDGRDGVFRHLDDASVGDVFTVVFDDGGEREYEVVEMAQYGKTELPFDRVFAKSGSPVITLITCGGDFQTDVSSYADNVVAYAVPV